MDNKKYLEKLPFWNKLTTEEKSQLNSFTIIKQYKKGDIIYSENDICLGAVMIVGGTSRVYIMSEEGREITLFRLKERDCCVLSASCIISEITFDTYMMAESDCDILIVNYSFFSKLIDTNIYVKCFVYELLTERLSTVMWVMQQILFNKLDRRLALFLADEYEKSKSNEIKMTQEEIAKNIGSTREVVTRMLNKFASKDLIEVARKSIVIKDIDKLKCI
ncbi:MAG: Crp/Fnr family transcriptional regulator [Eubacterium sp.]|nr:Crp/Fnr family transcriptional regulator [Eubacterium sp.]